MVILILKSTAGLKNCNMELKVFNYDLNQWREKSWMRLILMLADGGIWWQNLFKERFPICKGCYLLQFLLRHPYFLLGGGHATTVVEFFFQERYNADFCLCVKLGFIFDAGIYYKKECVEVFIISYKCLAWRLKLLGKIGDIV